MEKPNFNDDVERRIESNWAIKCAIQMGANDLKRIKGRALELLALSQEIENELNVCQSCGGISDKEKVVNGLHMSCRKSESYKKSNL